MQQQLPNLNRRATLRGLKQWQRGLRPLFQRSTVPRVPWNFAAAGQTNGILLTWQAVNGADGYEVMRSDNADFSQDTTTFSVASQSQASYFDTLAAAGVQCYYKIRATAPGNVPQAVKGNWSGIVTAKTGTSTFDTRDTLTTDDTQSAVRFRNEALSSPTETPITE